MCNVAELFFVFIPRPRAQEAKVDSADSVLALSSKIVFEGDVGEPMADLGFGAVAIYQWNAEAIGEKAD